MNNSIKSIYSISGVLAALFLIVSVSSCIRRPSIPVINDYPTMEIVLGNTTLHDYYTVSVRGKQNVEIRPQVNGLITEICINEGAEIRKGQPLFVIDQVPYKAALETAVANVRSAEAKVATARLTVESNQELYNQQVISEFDLQTAKNTLLEMEAILAQAKASEVNAQNNLSYTVIKSPVDGVASMIPYKVGALVTSSITVPLTTVSNGDEMHVYFSMSERQILNFIETYGSLQKMMESMPKVELVLSNGSTYAKKGEIDAISGTIDAKTGAVAVRAAFPNPDKLLINGGTAKIVIPYEMDDCIIIPQSATFEIQNQTFVYRIIDGKTKSTPIKTISINDGKNFVVESGLQKGDIIISEGAGMVRDDVPANITHNQN